MQGAEESYLMVHDFNRLVSRLIACLQFDHIMYSDLNQQQIASGVWKTRKSRIQDWMMLFLYKTYLLLKG